MAVPHFALALLALAAYACAQQSVPAYVKPCQMSSPKLNECVIDSLHHLRPFLAKGIPEVNLASVEPFILDSLSLALTGGEKGYKITLRDLHMYGVSKYVISKLKLPAEKNQPFESSLVLPEIKIDANYTSSGQLLILPASGGGLFHAELGKVAAVLKGFTSSSKKGGKDYLNIDKLDVTLSIKDVKMNVRKLSHNNKVLADATNLFLQENGHEVLNVMMPQLRVKIAAVIKTVLNHLLSRTPVQVMTFP